MKTIFDNSMVAHVWASQKQREARSGNGNFYFQGPALYSYGTHYVVGFLPGNDVALLNSDGYSVSTNRHKSNAWRAVRHMTIYNVPGLTGIAHHTLPGLLRTDDADARARHKKALQDHVRLHAGEIEPGAACYLLSLAEGRVAATPKARLASVKRAAATFRRLQREAARIAADKRDREAARVKRDRLAYAARAARTPDSSVADYVRGTALYQLQRTALELFHAQRAANKAGRTAQAKACARILKQVRAAIALDKRKSERKDLNRYTRTMVRALRPATPDARVQPGPALTSYHWGERAKAAQWVLKHGRAVGGLKRATFESIYSDATAKQAEIQERENRERFEREAAKRAAWLAGEAGYWHGSDARGGALLRAVKIERDAMGEIVAGELQTSWGANVPLAHAVRAFRFIKLCHDTGRAFQANGRTIRVGHFAIDRVEPSGDFKAGCHTFNWQEIERVARALGVFELSADDSAVVESAHA